MKNLERNDMLDYIRSQNKLNATMTDKPIIRHCRNCKYGVRRYSDISDFVVECSVKYKSIVYPRLAALLCRYYKEKGDK